MPRKAGRRRLANDTGAGLVDYIALLALISVVSLMLINTVPPYIGPAIESALCRIFNGASCESPQAAPDGRPTGDQCVVASDVTDETESHRIAGIGNESSGSTQIDRRGDGGITLTQSDESGWGVQTDLWVEASIPDVLEGKVSVGGGLLWTNADQDQFAFTGAPQMRSYHTRVQQETQERLDEGQWDELGDVGYDVAEDMGIPYTHVDASGPSAFVEVSGELEVDTGGGGTSVYGGGLEAEHARLIGTSESVDENGATTYGDYYSVTNSLSGELNTGVGFEVSGRVVEGGYSTTAGVNFSTSQSNVVQVEYDDAGNPLRITSNTTTQFHTGTQGTVAVEVDVDSINPEGQITGGGGYEHTEYVQDGDVAVTTTTIEIPPHLRERFRDTSPQDWAGQDFDFDGLLRGAPVTTTMQNYDSHIEGDEDDFVLEAGVGVPGLEVGGTVVDWGSTSETNEMGLESAVYRDPVTGRWRDWVNCRGAN